MLHTNRTEYNKQLWLMLYDIYKYPTARLVYYGHGVITGWMCVAPPPDFGWEGARKVLALAEELVRCKEKAGIYYVERFEK